MQFRFKALAAAALSLAAAASFASDLDPATLAIGTPLADVEAGAALFDTFNDGTAPALGNAVIAQFGEGNIALIDQTGVNAAVIAQDATNAANIGYILQNGTGNIAGIAQR